MIQMKQVKYSYIIDENKELVNINSITIATRYAKKYYCLQCGQEMTPNLGKQRAWHFSHKIDSACDGESYLHKLAKIKIREHFTSSEKFKVQQRNDKVPCVKDTSCIFYDEFLCSHKAHRWYNLKEFYDTCEEEQLVKGFVADLLLTNSMLKEREPVLIEINVTHPCDEQKKSSGLKIIEAKITCESDIDDIVKRGFRNGYNCSLYNFKQLPKLELKVGKLYRFILHKSGGAIFKPITCKDLRMRLVKDSIAELNLNWQKFAISSELPSINIIQLGLIYLKHKGLRIENCRLCKYFSFDSQICCLYKKYGTPHFPHQTFAKQCQRYHISDTFLNIFSPDLINKNVTEVM